MRIEPNTSSPQPNATEKARNSSAGVSGTDAAGRLKGESSEDRVTLSAMASQAMKNPDVRQDKVDAVRQSITSGQYKLDPDASAEAMLRTSERGSFE